MSPVFTTTSLETPAEFPVRERREQLGLSRHALAAHAGCSVTYLQNIEAGVIPGLSRVLPRIEATLAQLESEQGT